MVHFLSKFSPNSERRLLALCKNNPQKDRDIAKWNKAAVHSLVRNLRREADIIDELEKAIANKNSKTKCVLVPRAPDNRLLVAHRRGLPQVVYCRLWRWPDLQSHHQIRAISSCESSPNIKDGVEQPSQALTICVNPYHYERLAPSPIQPIRLAHSSLIPPDLSTSFEDSDSTVGTKARLINSSLSNARITKISRELKSILFPHEQQIEPLTTDHHQHPGSSISPRAQLLSASCSSNPNATNPLDNKLAAGIPEGLITTTNILNPDLVALNQPLSVGIDSLNMDEASSSKDKNAPSDAQDAMFGDDQVTKFEQDSFDYMDRILPDVSSRAIDSELPELDERFSLKPKGFGESDDKNVNSNELVRSPMLPISQAPDHQQQSSQQLVQPEQQQIHYQQQPHQQQHYQQAQQRYNQSPQYQQYPPQYQPYQSPVRYFVPEPGHDPQQQQLQQPVGPSTPSQSQYHQFHSQVRPQQSTATQVPISSSIPINTRSEIARPYQFKPHKFANLARARHDHNPALIQSMNYDPHGHVAAFYASSYSDHSGCINQYPQQQPQQHHHHHPHQQHPQHPQQQPLPQQYQQQQQCSPTATYTQVGPYGQHSTSTAPTYTTMYTHQAQTQPQYPQQEQMHLDYDQTPSQQSSGMSIRVPTQQQADYYGPQPGPSHNLDIPMDQIPTIDIREVPFTEGASWCSITYHEYEHRVGEKYQPSASIVSVDGYTQPMCADRFCLGGLSNINRNQFTEWVRRRIGQGFRMTYVDGEVYVESHCESSIFVSNPLLIQEEGGKFIEQVSKMTNGCSLKVFSTQQFSKILKDSVSNGFEAVYKLTNSCIIRVSFVKGWGHKYKRQSIFNTPCWVEVQLNGPLQWIDSVLRQMRPPTGCGSTS